MNFNDKPSEEQLVKYNRLIEYLKGLGSVAVAFSSGVDSTFLLFAAKEALGDKLIAITASLHSFPQRDKEEAIAYCKKLGVNHKVSIINELDIPGFAQNPPDRCYLCKKEIFGQILSIASSENINAVVEGSNLDDNSDYRPGHKAIAELGIISPLRECEFTKEDIRVLSKYLNIPTWNKPSFACLSSRFAYGQTITEEKLMMVERAEQMLFDMGFSQFRVRLHDMMARIEIKPEEFDKLISNRNQITVKFKEIGFTYVAMDLTGYRTGSMNETL